MSGFWSVFTRDLVRRRMVLLLAAATSAVAMLLPWVPGLSNQDPVDVHRVSAVALGLALAVVAALVLGATCFVGDLVERRLGFDLARPVTTFAVWAGRWAAVVAVAATILALVIGPALIPRSGRALAGEWLGQHGNALMVGGGGLLLLMLAANGAALSIRVRSVWLAADLGGLGLVATGLCMAFAPLRPLASPSVWNAYAVCIGFGTLAALTWASIRQLTRGRVLPPASHGAYSRALWTTMAGVVAIAAAFSWWLRTPSPQELDPRRSIIADPNGRWVSVAGFVPDRFGVQAGFMVNTERAAWFRFPVVVQGSGWGPVLPRYSTDGTRVLVNTDVRRGVRPIVLELGPDGFQPLLTGPKVADPSEIAMSRDGSLLAMVEDGLLTVTGIDNRQLVASARVPEAGSLAVAFDSANIVRVMWRNRQYRRSSLSDGIEFAFLDPRARRLEWTARVDSSTGPVARPSCGGRHWIFSDWSASAGQWIRVIDPESGVTTRELGGAGERYSYQMLPDGKELWTRQRDGRASLIVADPEADHLVETELGPATSATLIAVLGQELVICDLIVGRPWARRVVAVDLAVGAPVAVADDVGPSISWRSDRIGCPVDRLIVDDGRMLFRWDPRQGPPEPILELGGGEER